MSELSMDPGVVRSAAGRLQEAGGNLDGAGATCLPAVDAGEWTGAVSGMVAGVTSAAAGLAQSLGGASAALVAASQGVEGADAGARRAFSTGGEGSR